MDFGAAGDGITDDTAAVRAALAAGRVVADGANRQYAVTGTLSAYSFGGIDGLRLRQLAPGTPDCRTLHVVGCSDFGVSGLLVDRNGGETVGRVGGPAGAWFENCRRYRIERSSVHGGGPGNGFVHRGCADFVVDTCTARDMVHDIGAVDDAIQGHWFDNCTSFRVNRCAAISLAGKGTVRFTRGFTFSGCDAFVVADSLAEGVDQGFDYTGSRGNMRFRHTANVARDCGTWGHKFANSFRHGHVADCTALRCGLGGFVCSGPSEPGLVKPRDIDFVGCQAIDTGHGGLWATHLPAGFLVLASAYDTDYPRAVRFRACRVVDTQRPPTTKRGFVSDVAAPEGADRDAEGARCRDCKVQGLASPRSQWFIGVRIDAAR